jgi:hypothetical protein
MEVLSEPLKGGAPKSAVRATVSAASRYFSMSSGDMESTAPMLSKP